MKDAVGLSQASSTSLAAACRHFTFWLKRHALNELLVFSTLFYQEGGFEDKDMKLQTSAEAETEVKIVQYNNN